MAEPTAQQVHIDTALTNVAIRYSNGAYIADQIFPNIPVQKQTDKYFVFAKADWYRDDAGVRAPGTRAPRVDYNLSTSNYTCLEYAAAKPVPDEVVENADTPLQPMIDATNYVSEKLLIKKEIDVFSVVFGSSVWSASATASPTWDDDASDPLTDIETGVYTVEAAIGRTVNTGVIGRGLWRYLKNHPDVIDRIKGGATPSDPALLQTAAVAAILDLPRLLVARAIKNTGEELATASYSLIGGAYLWVGYVTTGPSISEPSAGYTFSWRNPVVSRFREDQEHQSVVEIRASWDAKATASDAGYLISAA